MDFGHSKTGVSMGPVSLLGLEKGFVIKRHSVKSIPSPDQEPFDKMAGTQEFPLLRRQDFHIVIRFRLTVRTPDGR